MLVKDESIGFPLRQYGLFCYLRRFISEVYQEVDSTNRAAKAVAVNGEAGHGSFVLARKSDVPDAADGAGVSIRRRMRESISV